MSEPMRPSTGYILEYGGRTLRVVVSGSRWLAASRCRLDRRRRRSPQLELGDLFRRYPPLGFSRENGRQVYGPQLAAADEGANFVAADHPAASELRDGIGGRGHGVSHSA